METDPKPQTTEALDYADLRRLMRDVRYHDFLRQGVAMALPEIERLNSAIRGAQIAFCHDNPDAAMAILVATGVQNAQPGETTVQAPAWTPLLRLELLTTQSGLLSLGAESPTNLHVVGRSLEEVFASLIQFIKDCDALGKPFAILEGVKRDAQP